MMAQQRHCCLCVTYAYFCTCAKLLPQHCSGILSTDTEATFMCHLQDFLPAWLQGDDDLEPDKGGFNWEDDQARTTDGAAQVPAASPWDKLNITMKMLNCISTQLQACECKALLEGIWSYIHRRMRVLALQLQRNIRLPNKVRYLLDLCLQQLVQLQQPIMCCLFAS